MSETAADETDLAATAWSHFFDLIVRTSPARQASLARRDLTPNDSRALHSLDAIMGKPIGALARAWECDPSNATFIIDRLERLGFCRRVPSPTDRRQRLVVLTPAGQATRDALQREFRTPPDVVRHLPAADLEALARILGCLLEIEPPFRSGDA